jgi:DNA-binding CsgD family transcriptional regulator
VGTHESPGGRSGAGRRGRPVPSSSPAGIADSRSSGGSHLALRLPARHPADRRPRGVQESAVGRGQSLLDASVTRGVIERLAELGRAVPGPEDVLSEREREVILLVAQGCTNKEIAAKLFLSPYTARNHVIHILDKLGLSRRSEAAAEAVRLGLLE